MADRSHTLGKPHLSVVVPAFNEAANLREHLPRLLKWLRGQDIHHEVVIVDDGSRDDTETVAKELLQGESGRVLHTAENYGKGHAVRSGFAAKCASASRS